MIQVASADSDWADLEEVRGRAPPPIRTMNLQIALRRRSAAGVAVMSALALSSGTIFMSALALSSGTTLLLQPQEAQASQNKKPIMGDCFFFANRWWCP